MGQWTFLSNHGRVFLYIAKHPKSTTEAISREVGLTQRGVQKIIAELEMEGYVTRRREGRCNGGNSLSGETEAGVSEVEGAL